MTMKTLADLKRRMVPGTKIMMTEYTRYSNGELKESLKMPPDFTFDSRGEKMRWAYENGGGIVGKVRVVDEEQPYKSYWYISGSRLEIPKAKELTFDEDGDGFSILEEYGNGSLLLRYWFL